MNLKLWLCPLIYLTSTFLISSSLSSSYFPFSSCSIPACSFLLLCSVLLSFPLLCIYSVEQMYNNFPSEKMRIGSMVPKNWKGFYCCMVLQIPMVFLFSSPAVLHLLPSLFFKSYQITNILLFKSAVGTLSPLPPLFFTYLIRCTGWSPDTPNPNSDWGFKPTSTFEWNPEVGVKIMKEKEWRGRAKKEGMKTKTGS